MVDQYLWAWLDRSHPVAVLKVRGELDAATAPGFAAEAARLLGQADGLVAVDLSFLDFIDCAGARALAAVVDAIPSGQRAAVCGIRPTVRRILDLIALDLPCPVLLEPLSGDLPLTVRGRQVMSQTQTAMWHSRSLMLQSSGVMARLAATYAEAAAAREHRMAGEDAKTERMVMLSARAQDLSARCRKRAVVGAAR